MEKHWHPKDITNELVYKINSNFPKIDTIAGVIYFGNNKEIRDINHCFKKQIAIA